MSSSWLAIVIVLVALYVAWPHSMTHVYSHVSGKDYRVRNVEGKREVADRLAALELRIRDFLHKAEALAPGDPRLANIRSRWNGTLIEIPKHQEKEVAFSVGKDAISLCVRDARGGLEPENTSMFVLLHELAHIATDSYGHKPEFWANMRFLLELAELTGTYAYQNFDTERVSYCGWQLSASPLTCVKDKTCKSELRSELRR